LRVGMCTKWIDEPYTGVGRYTIKVLEHMMDLPDAPEFHLIHKQEGGDPAGVSIVRHPLELDKGLFVGP